MILPARWTARTFPLAAAACALSFAAGCGGDENDVDLDTETAPPPATSPSITPAPMDTMGDSLMMDTLDDTLG